MGTSGGEQVPCIQMEVLVADEEERTSARSALEDVLEIDRCPGVEGSAFRSWDGDGWFSPSGE